MELATSLRRREDEGKFKTTLMFSEPGPVSADTQEPGCEVGYRYPPRVAERRRLLWKPSSSTNSSRGT